MGCPFEYRLPMDVIPASSVMGDAGHGFQGRGVVQDKISEPTTKKLCSILDKPWHKPLLAWTVSPLNVEGSAD